MRRSTPLTLKPANSITADDVFMDWAAAMYLQDESVGDGRYTYHNYPNAPQTSDTEVYITIVRNHRNARDVHQYGIDYINISCAGEHTLYFTGSTAVQHAACRPIFGLYAFATNRGNESDMTLTREFDFTDVSGAINLSFRTWYDLEKDYDYLYLEVSEDGETWQIITTPSGTGEDPSGNSYGWGYNGATNDWIQEEIDLSQYAGKKIQVRFEYVTDAAVLGEGFLLDDVSVDAINYQSISKLTMAAGRRRASRASKIFCRRPSVWRSSQREKTAPPYKPLNGCQINRRRFRFHCKDGEEAILIVTGTTRYTRKNAAYQVEIK